jgi:hypothetical protein
MDWNGGWLLPSASGQSPASRPFVLIPDFAHRQHRSHSPTEIKLNIGSLTANLTSVPFADFPGNEKIPDS